MRAFRKGFTLIELLVVLVVLGILSGIAIARFVTTKEAAYEASMKADLRNFALYEQNYLIDSQGSYFAGSGAAQGFVPTVGVTVSATADPGPPPSWQAIASHNKTSKTCSIVTSGVSAWDIDCP
ncbi:MAG TPA: prepilin-type N-terminal cleavage/methylation domain-containing protein [Gemmatimonadaceae bacterium]|jgi:prepilin-type N-terminal cleavage/methylation domain-containing protein|nr:prepilin-type N-terminal cleavage/methylation domain-containing protein [Gemmatimonadaceae bacterium]HMI43451.1 prepilin-type N-terminal cleavage/methylation domain-containing protein [Gemmatimonadaceae bacterium]